MIRPGWDETCMNIVQELAKRATCNYYKVGCLFLNPKKVIVASGYNGPPRKFPHCTEVGCNKDKGGRCTGAHAELNALTFCVGSPHQVLENSTLYITLLPCNQCMKSMAQCAVKRIVFIEYYHRKKDTEDTSSESEKPEDALIIAQMAGIRVEQYNPINQTTNIVIK
jgi:dCMP deaminase